jgi:hypothetical protein
MGEKILAKLFIKCCSAAVERFFSQGKDTEGYEGLAV